MNQIVLVEPVIPPNTGNIARTCVATNSKLHLVEPLGFSITDKAVKRAGLDYWFDTDLQIWPDLDHCLRSFGDLPVFYVTTKAKQYYTELKYPDNSVFFFGKEDKGLPEDLLFTHLDQCIRIPMSENKRSLNLANSVSIVLYEALRQQSFPWLSLDRGWILNMSKKERMFNWASCELSGFQKGFITIKIDFISNILSWKSAKQWNNNFVQGLPKAQMKPLYESLDKFLQENSDKKPTKITQPEPYVWIIQYGMPDEIIELQGYDIDFDSWKELITAIEKVSRREFKL